ncbi:MAG: 50S ribosomal protein L10 [Candidatus Woesearchaeota archaeon]
MSRKDRGKKTSNAAPEKKAVIKKIQDLAKKYPIVGILNMHSLPAAQLARMKAQLRQNVEMMMAKRTLILLALDKLKASLKGIEGLEKVLPDMPALIFTKENPFTIFKIIKKNKSKAPAKAGQLAPFDLIVPAGPTPFAPGPVLSELSMLGIKAGVEGGKVAVKQDCTVCKAGQPIKPALASMLARLGIEPMEIGLDLVAVYEGGMIYPKNVLDIDEAKFMSDLTTAASWAFNLAIEASYPSKDTAEPLLQKAFREAKAVALEGGVMEPELMGELLAKAEREAMALQSELPKS